MEEYVSLRDFAEFWRRHRPRIFIALAGTVGVALSALPLSAQNDTTSSERDRSATGGTGNYGSSADYSPGSNWGWIGILGLAGLLGLRGASRTNYDDYRTRPGPA